MTKTWTTTTSASACRPPGRAATDAARPRLAREDRRPRGTAPRRNRTRPPAAGARGPRAALARGPRQAQGCSTTSRPRRTSPRPNCCSPPTRPASAGSAGSARRWSFAFLLGMTGVFGVFLFNQAALAPRTRCGSSRSGRSTSASAGWSLLRRSACCTRSSGSCSSTSGCARTGSCASGASRNCRSRTRLRWLAAAKSAEAAEQIETLPAARTR